LYDICRGANVDPGLAEQYRQLWLRQAQEGVVAAQTTAVQDCPHRGEQVSENGEQKLRDCVGCGGRVRLKVFSCLHPAREPDEITLQDCGTCLYRPRETTGARKLILKNHLSPGDVTVMTAAIYSLHKANPGQFVTAVDTTCNAVFEHNPDVVDAGEGFETMEVHYPAIDASNQRLISFASAYCEFFSQALSVPVPLLTNRPAIHLSKREKSWTNQVEEMGFKGKFWLICAGRKDDYTAKFWGTENYQRVVDLLRGKVLFVQIGAAEHHHPPLRNVVNLVGKTDARQLIRLVWHSQGALGGVTFLQHLAAGLEKPYICIMGGREPVAWNSYPKQFLLHVIGALDCCQEGGCWRSRTQKIGDGDEKDKSLCEYPVPGEEAIPRCMALIQPEEVVAKILLFRT
jgi:ADP-heptose:LPS heptosyltransferase